MSVDRLHPHLRYHIVNSLGWSSLRPLQKRATAPILDGKDTLLLAPTAGGKTEAALFPVLSRLLEKPEPGLRLIYICPIKALLNNLLLRLTRYADLLGLRCDIWHGDVPESKRRAIRKNPPDILLTTPESLEVLLISRRVDHAAFFGHVRFCIVDEIHAFAGDDRGRHLLGVLHRIGHYAPGPIQRLGLSATVGNPDQLLAWLKGPTRAGFVITPGQESSAEPEVYLDYMKDLNQAADLISRLYRGEKRLVFCDSRARVEELSVALRERKVTTFVSHGSLGLEERRAAEEAFAQGENCVIVATSTLELGIDVGDLDRVIQIDAPSTVASFLQRIGRTGRRPGSYPNCHFLATNENALLQGAGLLRLWRDGYVEPVTPPPLPFHILAQQMMALCLERGGVDEDELLTFLDPAFSDLPKRDRAAVLRYMCDNELLSGDGRLLWMGEKGEKKYGRRHFMKLFSVFVSPPEMRVMHGRKEIGQMHQYCLIPPKEERDPKIIMLAGRLWEVLNLDWEHRVAEVKPSQKDGKSRWLGGGMPLHFELCQAVAQTLADRPLPRALFSKRGALRFESLRRKLEGTQPGSAGLSLNENGFVVWWTFAGTLLNQAASHALCKQGHPALADPFRIIFLEASMDEAAQAVKQFLSGPEEEVRVPLDGVMLMRLKFSECLPSELIARMFAARLDVRAAFRHTRKQVAAWKKEL